MSNRASTSSASKYYISDFKLLRRLREYLTDIDDIEGVDKDSMVEDLRNKFKEYGRRQKSAFRALVIRAYNMIIEEMRNLEDVEDVEGSDRNGEDSNIELDEDDDGGEEDGSEDNDEEENEGEEVSEYENESMTIDEPIDLDNGTHSKKNLVMPYVERIANMTSQPTPQKASEGDQNTQDPINISSDDEEMPQPGEEKDYNYRIPPGTRPPPRTARKSMMYNPVNPVERNLFTLAQVRVKELARAKRKSEGSLRVLHPKRMRLDESQNLIPKFSLKSFGGFSKLHHSISQMVLHLKDQQIYKYLGVPPPRGFLLHGPPGCGKSLLAEVIAGELAVPLIKMCGSELVAGISGESENNIRKLFTTAITYSPCVLFLDEIDAICPPRDTARQGMEKRIVAQLISSIDGLNEKEEGRNVVIVGATNRPDAIDPALRRAGRFDREICLGIPDRPSRLEILQVNTKDVKLKPGVDLEWLASVTPGYVGADLNNLMAQAAHNAFIRYYKEHVNKILSKVDDRPSTSTSAPKDETSGQKDVVVNGVDHSEEDTQNCNEDTVKVITPPPSAESKDDDMSVILSILKSQPPILSDEQLEGLYLEKVDFDKALKVVQPSAKREGFATVPDVTWDDIGSLRDIRSELEKSIMLPVKFPKEFAKLGIDAPSGILLCGPPGCGKTLLAKAVANEANINFISVKGPELLNMYVGESERAVRQVFQRAKNSQPCVIFFDEVDAIIPKRASSSEGHNTTARVVNQVLTEMDGVEDRKGVFVMAATNRPDMVDPAVLRPGRLDKILYVGLPSAADRTDILKALTKNGTRPPMKDVDLESVGASPDLEGFTGADLAALVKESALMALTEFIDCNKGDDELFVNSEMIYNAAKKIRPSVSPKEREHYERLQIAYGLPSFGNKKS